LSLMHGPCSKLKTPEDLGINRFREYTPPEKEKERERDTEENREQDYTDERTN